MAQLLEPEAYASLALPDQWVEDLMQEREVVMLLEQLRGCQSVIELGWGSGIVANALKANGKDVLVLEGSIAGCRAAYVDKVPYFQTMFEDYETSFPRDAVIASFVLEHVAAPVDLLKRARQWGRKLIVVAGNAVSYHRQIAVHMGLQPRLDSLSERDRTVGHYRVYSLTTLMDDLNKAGWSVGQVTGIMFKPLPNSMLAKLPRDVVKAMCDMPIGFPLAANIMVTCE